VNDNIFPRTLEGCICIVSQQSAAITSTLNVPKPVSNVSPEDDGIIKTAAKTIINPMRSTGIVFFGITIKKKSFLLYF
jgi:hypothetical protein